MIQIFSFPASLHGGSKSMKVILMIQSANEFIVAGGRIIPEFVVSFSSLMDESP